jgi:2'-5' RNA ligase
MRTFVALELPEEFLISLTEHLEPLREKHPGFRWTKEKNLHITLAFFGELTERNLSILKETAGNTARKGAPFSIGAGQIFTLPRGKRATVLALGIGEGQDRIAALAAGFEQSAGTPEPGKRPFTPHITLARRGGVPLVLSQEERDTPIPARGKIKTLTIFKSELFRSGPVYTPLAIYPLGNNGL